MDTFHRTGVAVTVCALAGLLLHCSLAVGAEQGQPVQKSAEQLLLEIMDLHGQLVTNEVFVAQAKMLGAYLETAQPLEEAQKVKIYTTVLQIISRIKESPAQILPRPPEKEDKDQDKAVAGEEKGKSVFVPGAAILEIFKAASFESIPKLPVIRTQWSRDLSYSGRFLLPERYSEIGLGAKYAARFSFYYEAKESGDYGFTIQHPGGDDLAAEGYRWVANKGNTCKLTIGGIDIVQVTERDSVGQGVCNLKKGFHRVEFWLLSVIYAGQGSDGMGIGYSPEKDRPGGDYFKDITINFARFEVKVLTPNALDAVPVTKDMMLLRADQKKAGQMDEPEKAKGKPIPYVDY